MTDKLEKLEKDVNRLSSVVIGITIVGVISSLLAVTTVGCVAIGKNELIATGAAVAWLGMSLWAGGGLFSLVLALDSLQVEIEMIRREIGGQK